MASGDWTQVIMLVWKTFYHLTYLTSSEVASFWGALLGSGVHRASLAGSCVGSGKALWTGELSGYSGLDWLMVSICLLHWPSWFCGLSRSSAEPSQCSTSSLLLMRRCSLITRYWIPEGLSFVSEDLAKGLWRFLEDVIHCRILPFFGSTKVTKLIIRASSSDLGIGIEEDWKDAYHTRDGNFSLYIPSVAVSPAVPHSPLHTYCLIQSRVWETLVL